MSKIEALKQAAEAAQAAHDSKKAELAAQGLNAKAREKALKSLKSAAFEAHQAYAAAAKRGIHAELTKIINAGAEERRAAKLARSPWKQAKAGAGLY